jgi:hypothetical protein
MAQPSSSSLAPLIGLRINPKMHSIMKTTPPRANFLVLALVSLSLTIFACDARANTIALSFTSWGPGNANGANVTLGWTFSLNTNVLVTDLGVFDQDTLSGGSGDGLSQPHLVTIWTSTGVALAQATIPAGSGAALADGFRFVSLLSPVSLTAGNYVIGAYYPNPSLDSVATRTTGLMTASQVTFGQTVLGSGTGFPTAFDSGPGYFGPNFEFTTEVPESGESIVLMSITVATLVATRLCTTAGRMRR